jgi:hypothetical protein
MYALFPYFSMLSVRPFALFHVFNMRYLPDIAGQILPVYLHDILYHISHLLLLNMLPS